MTATYKTLIFTDSRGKGLARFIENYDTPDDIFYILEIRPGWSLDRFAPRIIKVLNEYNIDSIYCMVFAGICGLTERSTGGNAKMLRYPTDSRDTKVNRACDTIRSLKDQFKSHINIATIIPADLVAYFKFHNPGNPVPEFLAAEQAALEADIATINSIITFINCGVIRNLNLINWITLKSKKKRQRSGSRVAYRKVAKLSYRDFKDGVHFAENLKLVFFRLLLQISIKDIDARLRPAHNSP